MPEPVVALLTDYGPGSEHVGALHAVLVREAPGHDRLDLAHDLPPGRVRWAAVILARLAALLPAGAVVIAVVDPSVGTGRRSVAARTAAGCVLCGPDNGLLAPAADALGGVVEAVVLRPSADAPATFHGRDVFAPAAAALARGVGLAELGEPMDPRGLVRPSLPAPSVADGRVVTEVVGWDRFGNVATLAGARDLAAADIHVGDRLVVEVGTARRDALLRRAFAEVPLGGLLVHLDSHGALAIAVNGGNAASLLGVEEGARVLVARD